jgi:uncharacterized protein (DUF1501 family)
MTAPPPDTATDCGCPEFSRLSRRGLLRASLAAGLATSTTAAFGTAFVETSYAATRSAPAVLVVLSMRGAVDGMSLVVPHGDPVYYAARPDIAVPAAQLLAKDGFFGLHPHLAPLLPLWDAGRMAAVHATGLPAPNRSHFSAMEEVEDAAPGSSTRTGWLNRLIGRDSYASPLQAVQIGSATPPTSLSGPAATVALERISELRLSGVDEWDVGGRRTRSMTTTWSGVGGPLGAGARAAMTAINDFGPVKQTPTTPANGASYPRGDFGDAMAAAARTIRGDVGAEVITVDFGSWDHHVNLGPLAWGSMQEMTTELAGVLAAFFTDLGSLASKVTVVALSEFGRRTKQNASYGLDHGWGNAMLLLGAGVNGGYHGTWPGLVNDVNGDLTVTTDYRSVLAEVVTRRLDASSATVFPGFTPEAVGVMA